MSHIPSNGAGEEPVCRRINITTQELHLSTVVSLNGLNFSMYCLGWRGLETEHFTTSPFPLQGQLSRGQTHLHIFALAFHTVHAKEEEWLVYIHWQKWTSQGAEPPHLNYSLTLKGWTRWCLRFLPIWYSTNLWQILQSIFQIKMGFLWSALLHFDVHLCSSYICGCFFFTTVVSRTQNFFLLFVAATLK